MLNIISFLIIILASLIGIKGGYIPNQLLNLGLLIVFAYIFSLIARFFRLPPVFGYIFAGIIAGNKGLGLALFKAVIQSCIDHNVAVIDTDLVEKNIVSQRIHDKFGFNLVYTLYTFHKWFT